MGDLNDNAPVEGNPDGMPWGCLVILGILGIIAVIAFAAVVAGGGSGFF